MLGKRSVGALVLLPWGMAALLGCGGTDSTAARPTVTRTVVETATVTATVTETISPSRKVRETTPDDIVEPPETTPSTPADAVTVPPGGTPLTLADFFKPDDDWVENRFDIADQKDVPGIAIEVCDYPHELELRLANEFQTLAFVVGQANSSESSIETLTVEIRANNEQVEIRAVPFNKLQPLSIPVAGVNALKIVLYGGCVEGYVTGVLSDVVLT